MQIFGGCNSNRRGLVYFLSSIAISYLFVLLLINFCKNYNQSLVISSALPSLTSSIVTSVPLTTTSVAAPPVPPVAETPVVETPLPVASVAVAVPLVSTEYYKANTFSGISRNDSVKLIHVNAFDQLIKDAKESRRKRQMVDLTSDPITDTMQILINTWINGSFSPVHKHAVYSEVFIILDGSLAFFTFDKNSNTSSNSSSSTRSRSDEYVAKCHVLDSLNNRAIVVGKDTYHAMCALPSSMGYKGYAVVFENSGHTYTATTATTNESSSSKIIADFVPINKDNILNGNEEYFINVLLKLCPHR